MKPQEISLVPANVSLTGFASAVTGAAWALTATRCTDLQAHLITIQNNSATDHSGKTVLLTGTDENGRPQTETVTAPGSSATVTNTKYFKTLTAAVPSATIGADTFNIGWANALAAPIKLLNWRSESVANINVDITGTINFTVQQTFDYPLQTDAQLQAAQWTSITALASKAADTLAQANLGATGLRLIVNSYSNGAQVQANVIQPAGWGV